MLNKSSIKQVLTGVMAYLKTSLVQSTKFPLGVALTKMPPTYALQVSDVEIKTGTSQLDNLTYVQEVTTSTTEVPGKSNASIHNSG